LLQIITLVVVEVVDQIYLLLLLAVLEVRVSLLYLYPRHNQQHQDIFTQDQDNGQHRQELLRLIMFSLLVAVAEV
jgi:hypothetical protein